MESILNKIIIVKSVWKAWIETKMEGEARWVGASLRWDDGCSITGKKIWITIIEVDLEIKIIQTVIFEFENVMHLFSVSLQKKHLANKNFENSP